MERKIIHCVSELKFLENDNLIYEQKLTLKWILTWGFGVLFFRKRKSDVIDIKKIIKIKINESFWTGNLIIIETRSTMYLLEAASKEHLKSMREVLNNSQLKDKLERKK